MTAAVTDRIELLGVPMDRVHMQQALQRCEQAIDERVYTQHMAVNAAKVVALQDDPELGRLVRGCELITADGQAVVWASRLLGQPLPTRVAGIDLMTELLALADRRGHRVFILGARPEVLARAIERISRDYPKLTIAGWQDGYFDSTQEAQIASRIRTCRPDMLFVAMPSPKKEYWLGAHGRALGVPLVMGVGGSIDVLAGETRRAPLLLRRAGLEWAFRLAQEPRRMFRRYLTTNVRFILLVARELIRSVRVSGSA